MIISCCGFGSSGSSVVTDYLKEFKENQVIDDCEFYLAWDYDCLIDLEQHLMHPKGRTLDSIVAIDRFEKSIARLAKIYSREFGIPKDELINLSRSFIDSIVQTSWYWHLEKNNLFFQEQFLTRARLRELYPMLKKDLDIE